jgi:tetratricopeptide (TPR) repeat protein/V8-like Glu-specific endopeptidase
MSRADAERRVNAFERNRGAQLLSLASHAALPAALDAQLVHLLRVNFFLDIAEPLPYAAEAQLLLSPLCTEIDDGFYMIGADERDLLLQRLVKDHGGKRLREVARLLWEYCRRGTPWAARAGLTEAQQLTAFNFIDPQFALAYLDRAEQGGRDGPFADRRWVVAMRQDLADRTAALATTEPSLDPTSTQLRALVDLGDALEELYTDPFAADRAANLADVPAPRSDHVSAPLDWRQLLEHAWAANRIPAVLDVAAKDHPESPTLALAIQEYWIRLSPALPVKGGRFEAPPPEWNILEQHRAAIERSLKSVCLFMVEGGQVGLGFLIGKRTILTHKPMVGLPLPEAGRRRALLAFADRHASFPRAFRERRFTDGARAADLVSVAIGMAELDEPTGACAMSFTVEPDSAAELPEPLAFFMTPPAELMGRKVYAVGYPVATDRKIDMKVVKRIMGNATHVLRVQPGEITELTGEIIHNCFTLNGNGGSPLIDLETGNVLGLHYAGHYMPGPKGLKAGQAIPLWPLLSRPVLARTVFAEPPDTSTETPQLLARVAQTVCRIEGPEGQIGNGFLVGPDLVLTCNHVISEGDPRLSSLVCRFGDPDGGQEATAVSLAREPLIAWSRTPKEFPSSRQGDLDYALIRLAERVGETRGWLSLSTGAAMPQEGSSIRIIAYPVRSPLHVLDARVQSHAEFFFYSIYNGARDQATGLSGAPCVDGDLNVIGIQQAGRTGAVRGDWRLQGVAINAIARDLERMGIPVGAGPIRRPHGQVVLVSPQSPASERPGAFSDHFFNGLAGQAAEADGVVTVGGIYRYVWGRLGRENDLPPSPQPIALFPLTSHRGVSLTSDGTRRALVAAIGHYRDPGVAPRPHAARGAWKIADVLAESGAFDVVRIAEDDVTRAELLRTITHLRAATGESDSQLLYVAGQSVPFDSERYLVLADSDPRDRSSMISVKELASMLRPTARGASVAIFDIIDTPRGEDASATADASEGEIEDPLAVARAALAASQALAAREPDNPQRQRDVTMGHSRIGDVLRDKGDLDGALAAYRVALAISERLFVGDPRNSQWPNDIAIGQTKLGDVLMLRGDFDRALDAYRASLAISEKRAQRDPADPRRQRDLAEVQSRIGDLLRTKGDFDGALEAYRASLAISEKLVVGDPANPQWPNDLAIGHNKVGDVLTLKGDLGRAFDAYHRSLAISERLDLHDPANPQWQRNFAESHSKIGDLWMARRDFDAALRAYQNSVAIFERLSRSDPAKPEWQREIAIGRGKIGNVLAARGDHAGALASYRDALAISEALARRDPTNPALHHDLATGQTRMADTLIAVGDREAALAAYRAALASSQELVRRDPDNPLWRHDRELVERKLVSAQAGEPDRGGASAPAPSSSESASPEGRAIVLSFQSELDAAEEGEFADLLIEALAGKAADRNGLVTVRSAFDYVTSQMRRRIPMPQIHATRTVDAVALTGIRGGKRLAIVTAFDGNGTWPVPRRRNAEEKARQLGDLLAERGAFEVIRLSGDGAPGHEVLRRLRDFRLLWDEYACCLFYFAGYSVDVGVGQSLAAADDGQSLVVADSEPGNRSSVIRINDIIEMLRPSAGQASVMIFDLLDTSDRNPFYQNPLTQPPTPPRPPKRKSRSTKKTARRRK